MAAIMPLDMGGPRDVIASRMVRDHLYNIIRTSGVVNMVETASLEEQMARFGVSGEAGQLGFARTIGASLVITGSVEERGGSIVLTLKAFGMDIPHNGREIYRYRAVIPLLRSYGGRDYSYIYEEHSGRFASGLFRAWLQPVRAERRGDALIFPGVRDGRYDFMPASGECRITGKVLLRNGVIVDRGGCPEPVEGDILLAGHGAEADFLDEFYYGRKRELVLGDGGAGDMLLATLFTPAASASMPFVAPVLGYYRSGDWQGLGLWALNGAPWLVLEGRGIFRDPDSPRDKQRTVGSGRRADRAFAWYFGLAGGSALFVDAFSHQYLADAADFNGRKDLMGNTAMAVYLSLVSGGGGHFYRGHRIWGYMYFHMNNVLLYGVFRTLLPTQRYNAGTYSTDRVNRVHAALWCSALALVKTVEVVHLLHVRDRVDNGTVEEQVFEPLVSVDERGGISTGLRVSLHF